ncbi:MAG: phosphatidylglycerol---prolipoprotein diacylglyceryl transferase [Actinomycetota bacterium]|nr:phosphatidylglycerol---prolipoprotein diacylglyceryl transferase [Actinomycetota bacterium]
MIFKWGINPLSWEILPRIHVGPLAISPHGIGIALGYLAGAQLMVRRARKRGGPPEADIWNALFYALIGAIVGARLGYVLGHFSQVTNGGHDLLGVFKVYQGGISLIGGITGAILAALPYILGKKMGFWRTMDFAAPGLALGIVIGRIGDLMIGDHLGKPTSFALGWHCAGTNTGAKPISAAVYRAALAHGNPPSLGCYNLTLHETALYDFASTILLLLLLLWLGRKTHKTGFMILVFTIWYGTMRVITDFLRVDRRYLGLTGSQISSIIAVAICLYLLARYRGAPPRWAPEPAAGGPPPPPPAPTPALVGAPPSPGAPGAHVEQKAEHDGPPTTEGDVKPE